MKINWKVRFKNKTWLITFLITILAFIYQILGMFDIVPPITQDMATQLVTIVINMLVAVGVVIDPTTAGTSDSEDALKYEEPKK
nr:MAG TPA: holin [Caudoviricetes sp.]